jgi:hypothetical protein
LFLGTRLSSEIFKFPLQRTGRRLELLGTILHGRQILVLRSHVLRQPLDLLEKVLPLLVEGFELLFDLARMRGVDRGKVLFCLFQVPLEGVDFLLVKTLLLLKLHDRFLVADPQVLELVLKGLDLTVKIIRLLLHPVLVVLRLLAQFFVKSILIVLVTLLHPSFLLLIVVFELR